MKRVLITSLSITILTLTGLLVATNAFADTTDVVDEIGIGVPISCTLSGIGNNSHTATIPNGIYSGTYSADGVDYTDGIGTTTLTAMCNDNEGFSIYAAGYTGDEIGGTNSTNLVGTTASGNSVIVTGTNTGPVGNTDTSNWAMKLSTISSPTPTYPITIDNGYNSYSAVPSSYTKVAHRDSATDVGPNGIGSTLTTTYAAYISKTQPADTYSGKVIYTLVHPSNETPLQPIPAEPGKICYYPNSNMVEGTMGCQDTREIDWSSCYSTDYATYCQDSSWNTIDINTLPRLDSYMTTLTLLASNFSREGYGFAGWSDAYDYKTNPNTHFYGPQEDFTVSIGTITNGLSLYAIWIKSEGSIQDTTTVSRVCNRLAQSELNTTKTLDSVSALTDQRDNETYAIAKLADGNCWMIENLRLENTGVDNANGSLSQGYGISTTYGNFSGLANPESANFTYSTTANSIYYSGTQSGDATVNIGTTNDPGSRFPRYNNTNTSARASSPTTNDVAMYSYGNYYTWHAAIADTTYHSSGDHGTTSLCPKGWRLPIGNRSTANMSFGKLSVELGGPADGATAGYSSTPTGTEMSKVFRSYPNNFLYPGNFSTSSANYRGTQGGYWSSTTAGGYYSYVLSIYGSNVSPGNVYNTKSLGLSIRCVAPGS